MKDIYDVKIARTALNDIKKLPCHITRKFRAWVDDVGHQGLMEVRKIPGYHDEPLKGKRKGQRSIRLSREYRAIYTIENDDTITFIEIREVNKHEY
jgi:proteic killer suppression protein